MKQLLWCVGLVLGLATMGSLAAQDEVGLRSALEGRRVTVKLDMPATAEGVDLFPGASRPIDFPKLSGRIKKYGVAIKDGESAMITKVKVKGDLIEIQLGGGGYGTTGDVFSSLMNNQGAESGAAQQLKTSNERTARLAAGSRFNLRYPNGVSPEGLTPESVVRALAEYATVSGIVLASAPPAPAAEPGQIPTLAVHKGQTTNEVQSILGAPVSSSSNGPVVTIAYKAPGGASLVEVDYFNDVAVDVRQKPASAPGSIRKGMSVEELEGVAGKSFETKTNGPVTTNRYHWQDGILEADFVNGVLVAYRIASN